MRAFAGNYYTKLRALYDSLGLKYKAQPFIYRFSKLHSAHNFEKKDVMAEDLPYFIHTSNSHRLLPLKPPGVSILSHMIETLYLLICHAYFTLCCQFLKPYLESTTKKSASRASETLGEYLSRIHLPRYFITHYFLPPYSVITTCPHEALLQFPACDFIEWRRKTRREPQYILVGGVAEAQKKLAVGIDVRFSAHVISVEALINDKTKLRWRQVTEKKNFQLLSETFDHVVLAVPPNVIGKVFQPLQKAMAQIPTILAETIVHTYEGEMRPQIKFVQNAMVGNCEAIFLRTSISEGKTESIHVQASGTMVTTCPLTSINPQNIRHIADFTRVLRTPLSRQIVNDIFSVEKPEDRQSNREVITSWRNGDGNVWLAGGWCWDGMVLLEGCIVSAIRIAEVFGV